MDRRSFTWILGLALLVRVAAAFILAPTAESLLQSAHHEHASIAKNLVEGRGFRFNFFGDIDRPDLTSQQAPFVPALLALAYRVFGVESPAALWIVVALQIVAGGILCIGIGDAVFQFTADRRSARLTAVLAAIYPPLVAAPLHLQALPWNLLWIALMLSGAGRLATRRPAGGVALAAGATGGLYTDPILAVVFGTLVAWRCLLGGVQGWRAVATVTVLVGLAVVPWTVRNYQVHGRLEFIKNSLPYVFWQGNTLRSAGTDKLPLDPSSAEPMARAAPAHGVARAEAARRRCISVNDVALTQGDLAELAALPNEAARMDWFGRRIRDELLLHSGHYPRMCLVRLRQWVWFDKTNPKSFVPAYRVGYLALAAGSVLGLLVAPRRLAPLLFVALALSAVHILIITSARFRVCLELLLIPCFAQGAVWGAARALRKPASLATRPQPPKSPL